MPETRETQEEFEERLRQLAKIQRLCVEMRELGQELGAARSPRESCRVTANMKRIAQEMLALSEGREPGEDA